MLTRATDTKRRLPGKRSKIAKREGQQPSQLPQGTKGVQMTSATRVSATDRPCLPWRGTKKRGSSPLGWMEESDSACQLLILGGAPPSDRGGRGKGRLLFLQENAGEFIIEHHKALLLSKLRV